MLTVGCELDLEALITHRALQLDDDSFDPSSNEPSLELSPELGIYPVSRCNPNMLRLAATSPLPTNLSLTRYSEVDVLVKVRRATASSVEIPSTNFPPSSVTPSDTASPFGDVSHFDFSLDGDGGPLEESVTGVFGCQHRLFLFMILFVEDKARLLHFDRTGASMTPEFDYTQRPEVIGKFLRRLSRNRATMGHDPTATRANEADAELFRNLPTRYHTASAVGRGLCYAATEGWPVYKLCIKGGFSPDGSTAVLPNAPVSRRAYLIGRPMRTWGSIAGRGTKMHVAYDLARDQVVVIKDSWRPTSKNIRSEYDTYLLLYASGKLRPGEPFSVPTLLGGGDVTWGDATQETRTSHPLQTHTRIHFRLVLKEVCRHLEDFISSSELVRVTLSALNGVCSPCPSCRQ